MNPITKFYYNHLTKQYEKDMEQYENQWEFIWGIKSSDDLSQSEVNLHTMNDIDITYDREDKKYHIGIETIYSFDDNVNGPKRYIKRLFDELTKWMNERGIDTNYKPSLCDVFTDFLGTNHGFDGIEELYGSFKFLVEKFYEENKELINESNC